MTSKNKHTFINKRGEVEEMPLHLQKEKKKTSTTFFYVDVGLYLAMPILLSVAAGLLLDSWFQTKPICTILMILIGTVGSFYNLFKIVKQT